MKIKEWITGMFTFYVNKTNSVALSLQANYTGLVTTFYVNALFKYCTFLLFRK
jgi:hypothetical protein